MSDIVPGTGVDDPSDPVGTYASGESTTVLVGDDSAFDREGPSVILTDLVMPDMGASSWSSGCGPITWRSRSS